MSRKIKKESDLQGITRLIMDATLGITDLVETMHKRVVHPPLLPSTPVQHLITGIASITYKNIRWTTKMVGRGLDKALGQLVPMLNEIKTTNEREAIRSALNGVVGDYLEEKENPLQIVMQFRYESKVISLRRKELAATYSNINGKILVMVHGSCMNDVQWTRKGHNHGIALANDLDKTPIYLHYNSGLHISSNGKTFNDILERLVSKWPVPVEEIVIIAHSMGGLVARSALYYGQQQEKSWIEHLKKIVFLGTPHHGTPLERTGTYLDAILEAIPYSKPFAQLGKIRSAGIADLGYGNLIDEDWKNNGRREIPSDQRQHISLPEWLDAFSIAAAIGNRTDPTTSHMLGDRLVAIKSALGQHKDPAKDLGFRKEHTWVAYDTTHLDLLNDPEVYDKIKVWLSSKDIRRTSTPKKLANKSTY